MRTPPLGQRPPLPVPTSCSSLSAVPQPILCPVRLNSCLTLTWFPLSLWAGHANALPYLQKTLSLLSSGPPFLSWIQLSCPCPQIWQDDPPINDPQHPALHSSRPSRHGDITSVVVVGLHAPGLCFPNSSRIYHTTPPKLLPCADAVGSF